jgi:hypothetical protein
MVLLRTVKKWSSIFKMLQRAANTAQTDKLKMLMHFVCAGNVIRHRLVQFCPPQADREDPLDWYQK